MLSSLHFDDFFFNSRYAHVASFEAAGRKQFAKASKDASSYVSGGAAAADDDDDDVDLFGSDEEEEDAEAAKIREERLAAYAAKKSKKPALIAKTSVLLDIKPWDDETDMNEMLKLVKTIEMDGLVWGASRLVPVGYGINKLSVSQLKSISTWSQLINVQHLQIMIVVEDAKVSIDELQDKICEFEDFVQSVDVAAMNKI